MKTLRRSITFVASLGIATTLSMPSLAAEGDAPRIANGTQAAECAFPPVVQLSGCTGTLVHPQVMIYAAHCGRNNSTIRFTHGSGAGFSVATERCETNPAYQQVSDQDVDWAFCVLAEPMTDIPIIPVAAGCEIDELSVSGGEIVQCGFGRSDDGGAQFGTKRFATSRISRVSGGKIEVGPHNGVVACPGDSGGPLLARVADGSWRTIGITSTYNGTCGQGGANTYADIRNAIAWIEERSGYDITPCFDDDQNWEPGPGCGSFYSGDAGAASGTWSDACEGSPVSGLSTTCGEQGGDEEAPTVSIDEPSDDLEMESPATLTVRASAMDNVGVVSVELFVNDESAGLLEEAPYEWELEDLAPDTYELVAIARDEADNEAESATITLTVTEVDDDTTPEDDDTSSTQEDDEDTSSTEESSDPTEDEDEDEDTEESSTDEGDDDTEESSTEDEGDDDDASKEDDDDDAESKVYPKLGDGGNSGCGCTASSSAQKGGPIGLLALALGMLGALRPRRRNRPV